MTQFDCTDIKAMLSAIVDDQLEAEARHSVERHLATCKPCRRVVDEAEAIDAILALDMQGASEADALPAGFEDSVLSRTVQSSSLRFRNHRWMNIGGWIASAAAIALAMTIWITDRRALLRQSQLVTGDGPAAIEPNPLLAYTSNVTNSWIYEGPVDTQPAAAKISAAPKEESAPPTIERIIQATTLTREDGEAIYTAALALDQLQGDNSLSFEDLDTVRRIVEYDDLLPRLAQARGHLNAEDRTALIAAESIFTRIVRGPINESDIAEISQTLETLELADRIARIGRRVDSSLSL